MVHPEITLRYGDKTLAYNEYPLHGFGIGIMNFVWRVVNQGDGRIMLNPPATVPLSDSSSSRDKATPIPILAHRWPHIQAINDDKGYKFCRSVGWMLINKPYDQESDNPQPPPVVESIGCGGMFFAFDKKENHQARVLTYNYMDGPLDPNESNYVRTPWMVLKAACISEQGYVTNPGDQIDAYWPLTTRGECWIHEDLFEEFPTGPRYRLIGPEIYDGSQPLMKVNARGDQQFPTQWHIHTRGPVPPRWWGLE